MDVLALFALVISSAIRFTVHSLFRTARRRLLLAVAYGVWHILPGAYWEFPVDGWSMATLEEALMCYLTKGRGGHDTVWHPRNELSSSSQLFFYVAYTFNNYTAFLLMVIAFPEMSRNVHRMSAHRLVGTNSYLGAYIRYHVHLFLWSGSTSAPPPVLP